MQNYLFGLLNKALGKVEMKGKSELIVKVPTKWLLMIFFLITSLLVIGVYKHRTETNKIRLDAKGTRMMLDDIIDSVEKQKSIIGNKLIEQSVSYPEMGAAVAVNGNYMTIVKKIKVDSLTKIPLANVKKHDYTKGYKFYPNHYLETPYELDVMFLNNNNDMEVVYKIHRYSPVVNIKHMNIGDILVEEVDGTYYISDTYGWNLKTANRKIGMSRKEFLISKKVELLDKL